MMHILGQICAGIGILAMTLLLGSMVMDIAKYGTIVQQSGFRESKRTSVAMFIGTVIVLLGCVAGVR